MFSYIFEWLKIIDNIRTVCGAGSIKRSSVRLSVPSIDSSSGVRAMGLLLCARGRDIDR